MTCFAPKLDLSAPGAVQFYPQPALPDPQMETLAKLTDADMALRLRLISQDAEGDPAEGLGELRLSLPGAQPKMALRRTDDGWHSADRLSGDHPHPQAAARASQPGVAGFDCGE